MESSAPLSSPLSTFSRRNSTSPTLILAQVRHSPSFPHPSLIPLPGINALDYRRVPRTLSHAYFSPLDSATRAAIDAQFATLTRGIPVQEGKTIRLWGRDLTVPRSAGHIAQFSFAELCGRPLGAADYLELTQRFRTLFVTDVPRMGLSEKDKVEWHQDTLWPSLLLNLVLFFLTRHGDSSRSSTHAMTAGPGCLSRQRFPSLRSSRTRILVQAHLRLITCEP
jgi:AFG1-like ATPase